MNKLKRVQHWIAGSLLVALSIGSSFADPNSSKIKGVHLQVKQGEVRVSVEADKPITARAFKLSDPKPQLVFDISSAVLWGPKQTKEIHKLGIADIRIAQFSSDPDVTRLVIDLDNPSVTYKMEQAGNEKRISIAFAPQPVAKTESPVSNAVASVKTETPKASTATEPAHKETAPAPVANKPVANQQPKWENVKVTHTVVSPLSLADTEKLPENLRPRPVSPSLQTELSRMFIARAAAKKAKTVVMKRRPAPESPAVSFSWKGADLTDVIRSLADRMGLNVIVDTAVKGEVTLDLKNVPAGQALAMILAINGYASRQIGNILVVGPPEKLDKLPSTPIAVGPQAIQVIPLENAKPAQIRDTVLAEYPEVKVDADARTNSLIVRGSVGAIRKVKQLVSELDKPVIIPASVAPQKEVIGLNYTTVKDVLAQMKPLVPTDTVLIGDERLNALIVLGSTYDIDTVKSFVAAVDVPSPQVMLEMQVISVEDTYNRQLGVEWPASVLTNFAEAPTDPGSTTAPTPGGSVIAPNSVQLDNLGIHTFVRDNIGFQAILHFLISNNKAKTLGAPRIATVNNKEANIQLGSRIPIIYFDPRAGLYQAQYIDVGVILKVTPIISPDGSITMHVNPQVSNVTGFTQNYPTLATRQADTTLRVKNGETVILGGLLSETDTDAITKIPLLGDIPIIGEFFRHRTTLKDKTDLIISITPTLLANK